jgi:hypothetical protein
MPRLTKARRGWRGRFLKALARHRNASAAAEAAGVTRMRPTAVGGRTRGSPRAGMPHWTRPRRRSPSGLSKASRTAS